MTKKDNGFMKIGLGILALLLITSCAAPKDIVYFQESENLEQITPSSPTEPTYKPQDIISIKVSAPDPDTAIPFNAGAISPASDDRSPGGGTATATPSYLIDANGKIEFPVLGTLTVAGLSSVAVKDMIKQRLKEYINDPIVSVKLENFKITILGEVRDPGPILIDNERMTLIEAIGVAGDLDIQGKRTNITVIREVEQVQTIYKVDLTSKDIFNSPVYYVAQNDIIYVEPNISKRRLARPSNWPRILTSVSSLLGIIISVIVLTR